MDRCCFWRPQDTVLGPLLFLAYINDLPNNLNSEVRLFADDCVVYHQIQNDLDHTLLQNDLITLEKWQNDWQMSFNVKKCFIMRITHVRNPKIFDYKNSANAYWKKQIVTHTLASTSQTTYPGLHISVISLHPQINAKKCFTMRITHNRNPKIFNYKLGECILETTNSHPYLGVCITSNLSWSTHINNITSSANRSLGFIRRNLYSCSKPIKQTAYMALVRPLLEYSNTVWDPKPKGTHKQN